MTLSHIELIPASDTERWHEVLEQTDGFDFYHLPGYHLLAEARGEEKAILFCYRELSRLIAWPFLLRSVAITEGL
jgi:hypothetical protein